MKKIYVSSTYNDLLDCRKSVGTIIRKLDCMDISMEYYLAEDKRPTQKCLDDVCDCDLYIGIFAWRYGWVPEMDNPEKHSITKMEYLQAVKAGKKCFIFLLDNKTPWPPEYVDDDKGIIRKFRDELSEKHGCSLFKNEDDLASEVAAAIHKWLTKDDQSASNLPSDFSKYFIELKRRYQRLDLEGLTPPEKEEYLQVQLRSVFVEQNVRDNAPPVEFPEAILDAMKKDNELLPGEIPALEDVKRESEVYYDKTPVPVLDIVTSDNHKSIIVLGDPGSGKSTLSRYIMLSIIDPSNNKKINDYFNSYLPLLVELRSYVALEKDHKDWVSFIDFLGYLGETEGIYPNKQVLQQYLDKGGKAVLIFDGLDEIFDPEEREKITRQIVGFRARFPSTRIIVTSRVIGYKRKVLTDAGFDHFTLQDLDEKQVGAFIEQWYSLVFMDRPEEIKDRTSRILTAFKNSASIRQLSGNPMLLTIMAIIGKNQELPRERWKLYDHAASVLIQHWDINRHLKNHRVEAEFIGEEDKREMLRRLAFKMQAGESGLAGNYIHKGALEQEFENYFTERYMMAPDKAKLISSSMIQQFRERNFILSLYGANLFGFVHRAFLEYFCASAFIYKFEKTKEISFEELKDVFRDHLDQSWHEVLRLISGIIAETFTGQIITLLSTEMPNYYFHYGSGKKENPPRNLSLAIKCLNEVKNLNMIAEPANQLLEKIFLAFEYDMQMPPVYFSFFKLQILPQAISIGPAWPYAELFPRLLKNLGMHDYSYIYDRIFGTFIGGLGRNNPEVKKVVLSQLGHADPRVRVLFPFALASGWTEDPATLPLLTEHAINDEHRTVRYAATYAISVYYSGHPSTFDFLVKQLTSNDMPFARAIAISSLAINYSDRPETCKILCAQASKETDKFPLTNIIKVLANYYYDREEVFMILADKAINDDSPLPEDYRYEEPYYMREIALDGLFRFWPNNEKTMAIIKDRSKNDTTKWLKAIARDMLAKLEAGKKAETTKPLLTTE